MEWTGPVGACGLASLWSASRRGGQRAGVKGSVTQQGRAGSCGFRPVAAKGPHAQGAGASAPEVGIRRLLHCPWESHQVVQSLCASVSPFVKWGRQLLVVRIW